MDESRKLKGRGKSLSRLEIALVLTILAIVAAGSLYFLSGTNSTRGGELESESADGLPEVDGAGEQADRENSDWPARNRNANDGQDIAGPDGSQRKGDSKFADTANSAQQITPLDPDSLSESSKATLEDFEKALAASDPLTAFGKERIKQLSAAELQTCLNLARNMAPSLEMITLLREVATCWAATNPKAAADYALALSSAAMRTALMTGVMDSWATSDPKAAAAFASAIESRQTRNAAASSLIDAWSTSDPLSALAWLRETPILDSKTLASCTTTLFQSLFKQDPVQAMAQVWTLPYSEMKRTALRSMVTEMTGTQNEAELLNMYKQLPAGADRILFSQAVVENLARYQPQKAQEWIVKNITDPEERIKAVSQMVATWSIDDPVQAAQWVTTQIASGDLSTEKLGSIMKVWVKDNPAQASEWLAQYPQSAQIDYAARALAEGLAGNDPATAARWAESITDINLRIRTAQTVARQWMQSDPAGAEAYINSSSLPATIKLRLLHRRWRH